MSVLAVVSLIGLIISVITGVDMTVAQAEAQDRSTEISKQAANIAKQIQHDRDLTEQLLDAYNRRDIALSNQLLQSSPFGTRIQVLKREYKKNLNNISDALKDVKKINQEEARVNTQIANKTSQSQTTGSFIMDSIKGYTNDPKDNPMFYNRPIKTTEQTIQEVNYGKR